MAIQIHISGQVVREQRASLSECGSVLDVSSQELQNPVVFVPDSTRR